MDKRIEKTKAKIFTAFKKLLEKKQYSDIVIQDILEEANISRSTFYSHYKTKEDVLESICSSIFEHVFAHTVEEEKSHDFSKSSILDYKHFFTHIFYHFIDEKELISNILSSQGKEVFLDLLRKEFHPFATLCIENHYILNKELPVDLQIELLIEDFITLLKYLDSSNYSIKPEIMTEFVVSFAK